MLASARPRYMTPGFFGVVRVPASPCAHMSMPAPKRMVPVAAMVAPAGACRPSVTPTSAMLLGSEVAPSSTITMPARRFPRCSKGPFLHSGSEVRSVAASADDPSDASDASDAYDGAEADRDGAHAHASAAHRRSEER